MNTNLAGLFRRIQYLSNNKNLSKEEAEEYEFYNGFVEVFQEIFVPGNVGSLIEINLYGCPFPRAEALARSLGFHLVTGSYSTKIYLSWPQKLDV